MLYFFLLLVEIYIGTTYAEKLCPKIDILKMDNISVYVVGNDAAELLFPKGTCYGGCINKTLKKISFGLNIALVIGARFVNI